MILLIDNYDSFVFNLERYFRRLGQETVVRRNDAIEPQQLDGLKPDAIVFSPGPCAPQQAGVALELVRRHANTIPMLGVCLGHQILAEAFGGNIVRAAEPMHGRVSNIRHDQRGVFHGLPSPLPVCRYHSLVVDPESLPDCLERSAETNDGVLMAFRHRSLPLVGLQFHPEAILTRGGFSMLREFLLSINLSVSDPIEDEWRPRARPRIATPTVNRPITF